MTDQLNLAEQAQQPQPTEEAIGGRYWCLRLYLRLGLQLIGHEIKLIK